MSDNKSKSNRGWEKKEITAQGNVGHVEMIDTKADPETGEVKQILKMKIATGVRKHDRKTRWRTVKAFQPVSIDLMGKVKTGDFVQIEGRLVEETFEKYVPHRQEYEHLSDVVAVIDDADDFKVIFEAGEKKATPQAQEQAPQQPAQPQQQQQAEPVQPAQPAQPTPQAAPQAAPQEQQQPAPAAPADDGEPQQ